MYRRNPIKIEEMKVFVQFPMFYDVRESVYYHSSPVVVSIYAIQYKKVVIRKPAVYNFWIDVGDPSLFTRAGGQ